MEFEKPSYTYNATLLKVIDGDTIDVMIDLGCHTSIRKRLRFLEIDTEELRDRDTERREDAAEAKERVKHLLENADKIYVQTVMDSTGKYGRLLAYVWYEDEYGVQNLNTQLLREGFQKKKR
jgi:micrococcal nuclease